MKFEQVPKLPATVDAAIGRRIGRQRAFTLENGAGLIIHRVPGADASERKSVVYWTEDGQAWFSWSADGRQPGIGRLLEEYADTIDDLDEQADATTELLQLFQIQRSLHPIFRSAKNLRNTLEILCGRQPGGHGLHLFLERAHEVERDVELLALDLKTRIDAEVGERLEEHGEASARIERAGYKLNLIVALFLPLTAIASAFGMNLGSGIPEGNPLYFWLALAFGVISGVVVVLSISGIWQRKKPADPPL